MSVIAQPTPMQIRWHEAHVDRLARMNGKHREPRVVRNVPAPPQVEDKQFEPIKILAIEECQPEPVPVSTPGANWRYIIAAVAAKHGISVMEIMSKRRKPKLVIARHEAFYRLSCETPLSLPNIGRKMGGFDHSTVIHGISRHLERMGLE